MSEDKSKQEREAFEAWYDTQWQNNGDTTSEAAWMARAALSQPQAGGTLSEDDLTDLIAEHLSLAYHCTRVWEAWDVGTMSQDDFEPVDESDTPREIAREILARSTTDAAQADGPTTDCPDCYPTEGARDASQPAPAMPPLSELEIHAAGGNTTLALVTRYAITYREAYEKLVESLEAQPAPATGDEREALNKYPLPWRVVQGNVGVPGATFRPVDIRSADNRTLFRVGDDDASLPLAHLIVQASAAHRREDQRDAERYRALRALHWRDSDLFVVAGHYSNVRLGTRCPSGIELDNAIDAAMQRTAAPAKPDTP